MNAPTFMLKEQGRQMSQKPEQGGANINVGEVERVASTVVGGVLMGYGLNRCSLAGLGLAMVGGAMAYRGMIGHCQLYGALGLNTAESSSGAPSESSGSEFRLTPVYQSSRPGAVPVLARVHA